MATARSAATFFQVMKKMADHKGGRILFSVLVVLVFQFFQLFRHEARNLTLPIWQDTSASDAPVAAGGGSSQNSYVQVHVDVSANHNSNPAANFDDGGQLQTPNQQLEPGALASLPSFGAVGGSPGQFSAHVDVRAAMGNSNPPGSSGTGSSDELFRKYQQVLQQRHHDRQQGLAQFNNFAKLQRSPKPSIKDFDPATFNYSQPAIPFDYTLPPPKPTNQSTVIVILTARRNFERRNTIRETYAKDNDNVFFIIGGPQPSDHEGMDMSNPMSTSSLLFMEQQRFGDIIDSIHPESYRSLPYKVHYAMRYVMWNMPHVNWIVKADDDTVVRVRRLDFFVLQKFNPNLPMVIGAVAEGSKPHRTGKWAEDPKYTADEYPPWAFGSSGYVVSRPVAQYVANHDLYYYQGEDAGLGIWLAQSPLQVTWVDTPEFRKDEPCHDKLYIIGHDLTIDAIRECFNYVGDTIPERKHIIGFHAGRKGEFLNRIRNPTGKV